MNGHVGGTDVDHGIEVRRRGNLEIQHVSTCGRDVVDGRLHVGARGILKDAMTDHEVVATTGSPPADVSVFMTEFFAGVFADVGGGDLHRRLAQAPGAKGF